MGGGNVAQPAGDVVQCFIPRDRLELTRPPASPERDQHTIRVVRDLGHRRPFHAQVPLRHGVGRIGFYLNDLPAPDPGDQSAVCLA